MEVDFKATTRFKGTESDIDIIQIETTFRTTSKRRPVSRVLKVFD